VSDARCPACDARNAEPAAENPAHLVNTGGRVFESRIVNVLCRDCGLIYNDPMPSEAELVALYRAMARDIADRPAAPARIMPIEREQAEYLAPVLADRAAPTVLDIGCSMGGFLAAVAEHGAAVVGVEPSSHDAAVARSRFGIDVREGFFEDLAPGALGDRRFDLVTLRFVFEHVREPRTILRRVRALLAPNGRVYLEVPNLATPFVGFDDFFSYGHLQTFTPESLAYLCAREGFAVERMDACANVFETSPHPPSIRAVLAPRDGAAVPPAPVDAVRGHLAGYRAARQALFSRASLALRRALDGRQRVVIYGAGTHTAELWRACPFLEGRVAAMVDGNPRLQGHQFLGVPVHSPRALAGLAPDLIVISVRTAERQIGEYLAAEGFGPVTLRLYEDAGAAAA
jgi:2-polyprenyl-3-methyl-5-hydroxy-6-metoxy-1,4-benzoquinol methylase